MPQIQKTKQPGDNMAKFTYSEYEELMAYVELEGTEVEKYLTALACVWEIPESHGKRVSLQKAVDVEFWHWLKRFRREATIIEVVEPRPDRVYKELKWY